MTIKKKVPSISRQYKNRLAMRRNHSTLSPPHTKIVTKNVAFVPSPELIDSNQSSESNEKPVVKNRHYKVSVS